MRSRISVAVAAIALVVVGVIGYALVAPNTPQLPEAVRALGIGALGAIITGLLAVIAADWGGKAAAQGARDAATTSARAIAEQGEKDRAAKAKADLIALKRSLVGRIAVLADQHARQVASQVARWQEVAGSATQPEPTVGSTGSIEDAVNELYALGDQSTADRAAALFTALLFLDRFCFDGKKHVVGGKVTLRDPIDVHEQLVWQGVEKKVKTDMMRAHQRDVGSDVLVDGGTLPSDYLKQLFDQAESEL